MSPAERRRGMIVSAEHLAKMAVELTGAVHVMGEHVDGESPWRWDVEMITARVAMDAIRRELEALEALLAPAAAEKVAA